VDRRNAVVRAVSADGRHCILWPTGLCFGARHVINGAMAIAESFAKTWFLPIMVGSAVAGTLIFMGRMFRKPRIPEDRRQLPPGIIASRNGDALIVRYRWGDGWSVLMLALFLIAVLCLVLDALGERATYPIHPAIAIAFYVIVPAAIYGLLLHAFNSTVYTLTSTNISARKGPLRSFGNAFIVDLRGVDRIVCLRIPSYSTYTLYAEPQSGPRRYIIRSGSSAEIAVALARLIPQVAPSIPVDIDV
jgi:hypothetical protein